MIWFLEGQSSQRDIIRAARQALPAEIRVLASHRHHRPEILAEADEALIEPRQHQERIDWILEQAVSRNIRVLHVGHQGFKFEAERARFEQAGLQLVTGALSVSTFEQLSNKLQFVAQCERAGLPVTRGMEVRNADQLERAIAQLSPAGPICVKPVQGIFGQGFWRLKSDADPLDCFADTDARVVNQQLFIDAYRRSSKAGHLMLMNYLPGLERSIDLVCEAGQVIELVGRCKHNGFQQLEREGPALELARQVAELFRCDGLINVQTKDSAEGQPVLLEINPRPSGGIGYGLASGINLPGIFACRRLGLEPPAKQWRDGRVRTVSQAVPVQ